MLETANIIKDNRYRVLNSTNSKLYKEAPTASNCPASSAFFTTHHTRLSSLTNIKNSLLVKHHNHNTVQHPSHKRTRTPNLKHLARSNQPPNMSKCSTLSPPKITHIPSPPRELSNIVSNPIHYTIPSEISSRPIPSNISFFRPRINYNEQSRDNLQNQ